MQINDLTGASILNIASTRCQRQPAMPMVDRQSATPVTTGHPRASRKQFQTSDTLALWRSHVTIATAKVILAARNAVCRLVTLNEGLFDQQRYCRSLWGRITEIRSLCRAKTVSRQT